LPRTQVELSSHAGNVAYRVPSPPSDLRYVERRRLVELVDPVAEQQVRLAAPAVLGLALGIVLREVVVRYRDRLAGGDVAEILVAQRIGIVLDVIEHVQRAVCRIVQ
jgi:hypothetical protein